MTTPVPLRRIFRIVNGGTPTPEPHNWDGDVLWATPVDLASVNGGCIEATGRHLTDEGLRSGSVLVPSGSLILSTRAPIGYVAEVTRPTAFNQGCRGLVPLRPIDPRFFRFQLSTLTDQLNALGQGSTFTELSTEALSSFRVSWQPPSRQRAIADFLERETTRIDALSAAKRRLAGLIEERWSVLVRESVLGITMGTTFPVVPLKRLWNVVDCKHRTPAYQEDGFPVVSPGDVTPGRLDLSRCSRFVGQEDFDELTSDGRRPRRGDIVYSRNASIGIASFVSDDKPFTMGQDVCLITSDDQDQRFLTYALNTVGLDQLSESKVGSTFSRINIGQIRELVLPGPSVELQSCVADTLDIVRRRIERIISTLHRQIELLSEHRQASIVAAVAGAVEVSAA